uniref:Uncharacterized protein n=1 Tax=Glossina palpalis gambiensis TaxID=67801 RepID=A0A1B0BIQ4_9MUSC
MKEELLMTAVKTCYNPTRHPRSRSRFRSPSLSICFFSYSLLSLFNILLSLVENFPYSLASQLVSQSVSQSAVSF